MLTSTEEIYKKNYRFRVYGTETLNTQVRNFLDSILVDKKIMRKLIAVLNAINTDPLLYSHEEKFKHLEKDVWEIKINSIRIACLWDKKPHNLIAFYGFKKKRQKWSTNNLDAMRSEKLKYKRSVVKRIEGETNENGRTKKLQG